MPVCAEISVSSPSVILMESSTGQVIYEQNATERRSPASITKIMTLLLTFDAYQFYGKARGNEDLYANERCCILFKKDRFDILSGSTFKSGKSHATTKSIKSN